VQRDFGGFDPAFVGVTLRFETERAWNRFQEIARSPVPIPVSSLPDDARFEALSLVSAISHEVRHFHDFLLSPYSARVFSLRLKALLNELGTLSQLVDPAVNCVPVPIPAWARLDAGERAARIAELGERPDGSAWSPPAIRQRLTIDADVTPSQFTIDADAATIFAGLMKAGAHARGQINDLTYNPTYVGKHGSLQPWQVFELSGYLVQIQDVYAQYGAAEALFLVNYLGAAGEGRNPYARMFHLAKSIWDDLDRDFDTAMASAMVVWSILGAYGVDGWAACPSERFVRLRAHTKAKGVPTWDGSAMKLFDEWSSALKVSTVTAGLREAAQLLRARATAIARKRPQLNSSVGEHNVDAILSVAEGVAAASEHMVESFLGSPDAYVAPHFYMSAVGSLANPVVRYALDGAGLDLHGRTDEFDKKGYVTWWAIEQDGKHLVFSWLVPFKVSQFHFIAGSDAGMVADLFGLTDYLFAETGRARDDVQLPGRIFFSEHGILPFDLLV